MSHPLFITVPETTLPNGAVVPAFQVGQYLCSKGEDGKATVSVTAKPWVRINFADAKKACEDAGFKLITELQCLAIAHNIAQQNVNWTGGKVGEGSLFMGLHRWTVNEAQAGDYVSPNENERRMFALSNGELICDAAGNAYTWVFDDVQGDEKGVVARPFAEDSPSITTAPFPSMQNGVGWYPDAGDDWSGLALLRGGYWRSYDDAGVFYLDYDWPGDEDDHVSFRCTKPVGL
jgi:hypothetical protein